MLSDLFYIELYFGPVEAAMPKAEMIEKYGADQVYTALALGLLQEQKNHCEGRVSSDIYCWLTTRGREKVKAHGHIPSDMPAYIYA